MNKAYTRIGWENEPSVKTPINEDNLNRMDIALNEVDNRVLNHETTKANVADIQKTIVSVEFEENTGEFRFTHKDGSSFRIDTKLEKVPLNYKFDSSTQQLVITNTDGTTQSIDISSFITLTEFLSSNTITPVISGNTVKFEIVNNSITEEHLETNYLSNILVASETAENASLQAQESERIATEASQSAQNLLDQVNKKLNIVEFEMDDEGNLVYTDNSNYRFVLGHDGILYYEIITE